jgi:uncharacterized membrane protein YbhN (UPF0104 family)
MLRLDNKLRSLISLLLLLIILGLFGYFIHGHPEVLNSLKRTSPWVIALLVLCYGVMLMVFMTVYNATLELCAKPLKAFENMLLSIYSTLANFFLPGQSGIGIRTGYLKRKYKVPISSYLLATLVYYAIYSVISAGFLFGASHYWYLTLPAVMVVGLISYGVILLAKGRFEKSRSFVQLKLNRKTLLTIFLATFVQFIIQAIIYGIELKEVTGGVSPLRILSYTGAADFSLFVALTPGAIGFREAFLALTTKLHGFSDSQIVAANIIDRGAFLIFLGGLFIIMVASHARNRIIGANKAKSKTQTISELETKSESTN